MPRPITPKTFSNLLQYYLSLYYHIRSDNPSLKSNQDKHEREILTLQDQFHQELKTRYPDWDTEENRSQLIKDIDFLTLVFTKKELEKQRKDKIKELLTKPTL